MGNNRKKGETRNCKTCGKEFYAPRWAINDPRQNGGLYCSRSCSSARRKGAYIEGPIMHSSGYLLTYMPEHPRAKSSGRVFEHILVAEQKLGRPLKADETVHHINGDKQNNHPDNLVVITNAEHVKMHWAEQWQKKYPKTTLKCPQCGNEFEATAHQVRGGSDKPRYCSNACSRQARRGKPLGKPKE